MEIERWHQSLRRELLDVSEPFVDLPSAQAAISAWVHTYNHNRPHQTIGMATPVSLFRSGAQPEPLKVVMSPPLDHEATPAAAATIARTPDVTPGIVLPLSAGGGSSTR